MEYQVRHLIQYLTKLTKGSLRYASVATRIRALRVCRYSMVRECTLIESCLLCITEPVTDVLTGS